MKRVTVIGALLLLGGCTSGSDYGQYIQAVRQGFAGSFQSVRVTRDQAAAVAYASLGYRVGGKDAQRMLVLATDTNGELLWTAASHVVLVTRNGRIVRSVGLEHDLAGLTPPGGAPLSSPAAAISRSFTSTRLEDFPDLSVYGVTVNCSAAPRGPETIAILGNTIATFRVDEHCDAASMNWSFTDSYWVDQKSGLVWRSIQHINPKEGRIEIEILRAPG